MANFKRKLIYKIYNEDGTYLGVLDDVISEFSIDKTINGGDGEFTISLARKIDDFEENSIVKFNNRVKVYLQDDFNLAGDTLIAYGYIVSYEPHLQGQEEYVNITCLSAVSKLKNDFYRLGTASAASELGVELTSLRADEMLEAIITHYRSTEAYSMISSDFSNSDSTTDNDGNPISFIHRFFNMKHLDALREVSKFLPRNKTGGYFFYWRIATDGKLWVKNIAITATHTFIIGKHIDSISGNKTIENIVNRVYFWNERGSVDPYYIKLTSEDVTSQNNYDIIANYISDSKITTSPAASLVSASRVYDKKDPKVTIKIELNGTYDLASIVPGQTCQILNAKNNPFNVGGNGVLLIHSIQYTVDSATLEVSDAQENFEDVVEEERMRLDLEMTWFGKITQALTAAQLSPANRTWTTTITFSATTGANAYRQIDWTAGIIYIPAGASGTAARRVIDIGNTGLMSPGSVYYIYLDEGILPTTAAVVTRTGTSKQGGDTLTDSASPGWTNDQWTGYVVQIGGQKKIIKSNTATVLTLEDRWTIADQSAQTYTIAKLALSVTDSEETAMADSKVVFTNAAANANTGSEAILVPNAGIDIIIDGATQIAKVSIVADNIAANTITANKLSFTAFEVGVNNLDDVGDGTTYGRVLQTNITAGQILLSACSGNLDNIANGTSYGKVALTAISAGKIVLTSFGVTGSLPTSYSDAKCTNALADQTSANTAAAITGQGALATVDNLDGVPNGTNYAKVYLTDINAGHITLIERTTSLRRISLDASVPHVKVDYNGTDVIQMCVVGTEAKLEIYNSGYIRTRLNKNGIYIFTTAGAQQGLIYGDAGGSQTIFSGTELYVNAALSTSGIVSFGGSGSNNSITGDGTHIIFNGLSAYHLIPQGDAGTASQLGTSTHEWYSVWALDTSINHDDLAEAEKVHPSWQLIQTDLERNIKEQYQIKNNARIKLLNDIHIDPIVEGSKKYSSKQVREMKIKGILNDKTNENFDIKKKRTSKIPLGSVVEISDDGCLPTKKKGQTNILGVVSTMPGLKLDSHAEGIFIAKVGKVPCRVIGKCKAGDLLQASDTEGCAEKAENPKTGSIVGRAKETKISIEDEKIKIEVQMM